MTEPLGWQIRSERIKCFPNWFHDHYVGAHSARTDDNTKAAPTTDLQPTRRQIRVQRISCFRKLFRNCFVGAHGARTYDNTKAARPRQISNRRESKSATNASNVVLIDFTTSSLAPTARAPMTTRNQRPRQISSQREGKSAANASSVFLTSFTTISLAPTARAPVTTRKQHAHGAMAAPRRQIRGERAKCFPNWFRNDLVGAHSGRTRDNTKATHPRRHSCTTCVQFFCRSQRCVRARIYKHEYQNLNFRIPMYFAHLNAAVGKHFATTTLDDPDEPQRP